MVQNISSINGLDVNAVQGLSSRERAVAAVKQASDKTGVDFSYLLSQAKQESGLNASAKASTSSATGLFQFIDQTWLRTVKSHGAEHGLGNYADKITVNANGIAQVSNPVDKRAILALRKNPEVASLMAAELANENKESLQRTVGGDIGATDLYMAHFLGAGGARKFLRTMNNNPNETAANILPSAASANKNVFFDSKTGKARSVTEVYAFFDKKFDAVAPEAQNIQVASAAPMQASYSQAPVSQASVSQAAHSYPAFQSSISDQDSIQSYSVGGGVSIGSATTTPFAAMIFAQMDMENFALDALANMTPLQGASKYVKTYVG